MRGIYSFLIIAGFICIPVGAMAQKNRSEIRGTVTDMNGNRLPGASISIKNTFLGTHSASDGTYIFNNLADGDYSLQFSYIGYESEVIDVHLVSRSVTDVNLSQRILITDEVVVNATRAGAYTPLAYTNISGSTLSRQNSGQDLPFLLALTPSLVETSEAGNGIGYTSLRIRGSDASRINVTIDGIPLNDPESQQVFWVDLPDLASSVDNIQVQRGVGTSSNGAGAFGASLNIQTRPLENEPFAEINTLAGSFMTIRNNIAAGTGLLGDRFALQLRFSDLKSDGYILRTGSKHRSANISAIYRVGKSRLKANILIGEEKTGIGWWGVPGEMLGINRRYNPAGEYTDENGSKQYYDNESDNYKQNHYQLIFSRNLNQNLSLNSALHYTKGEGYYEEFKEDRSFNDYGLPDVSQGSIVIEETDLVRRKWMSNHFYGSTYSLTYRKERIEAVLGGGLNNYLGDHFGRLIWMRIPGNTGMDHQWYLNTGNKGEVSIYGKLNYMLSDRTSVYGDLQYRFIKYALSGIDDDLKDLGQEHRFNFFNPKAGLFFTLTPNQDAYFSFAVANREPTRTDFKEASGDESATPGSEKLFDAEAGYNLRAGTSTFSLNLYGMFYRDQLIPTGELSNVGYPIMTNVSKSYRIGSEVMGGVAFTDFMNWNFNITLSSNKIIDFVEHYVDYNTSDWSSEYKNKNLGKVDIAYSPSVTGSSDLDIKVTPGLNLHFISKYVGKQYFDNTMNSERMLSPYFVNNIRVDFEPAVKKLKSAQFQFYINNIFNAEYESNAYGGNWYENGTEKTWSYYFPQAGTNFMIKLGIKF